MQRNVVLRTTTISLWDTMERGDHGVLDLTLGVLYTVL